VLEIYIHSFETSAATWYIQTSRGTLETKLAKCWKGRYRPCISGRL